MVGLGEFERWAVLEEISCAIRKLALCGRLCFHCLCTDGDIQFCEGIWSERNRRIFKNYESLDETINFFTKFIVGLN